mmetsp:Transcript_15443/g.33313  ORF Transcript_15443/g.33313 Transcript_15443/m.33313 type:complete len:284 (-) Transcript_15443:257-1108(-)
MTSNRLTRHHYNFPPHHITSQQAHGKNINRNSQQQCPHGNLFDHPLEALDLRKEPGNRHDEEGRKGRADKQSKVAVRCYCSKFHAPMGVVFVDVVSRYRSSSNANATANATATATPGHKGGKDNHVVEGSHDADGHESTEGLAGLFDLGADFLIVAVFVVAAVVRKGGRQTTSLQIEGVFQRRLAPRCIGSRPQFRVVDFLANVFGFDCRVSVLFVCLQQAFQFVVVALLIVLFLPFQKVVPGDVTQDRCRKHGQAPFRVPITVAVRSASAGQAQEGRSEHKG